jgi:hypothetical protein
MFFSDGHLTETAYSTCGIPLRVLTLLRVIGFIEQYGCYGYLRYSVSQYLNISLKGLLKLIK